MTPLEPNKYVKLRFRADNESTIVDVTGEQLAIISRWLDEAKAKAWDKAVEHVGKTCNHNPYRKGETE